MLKYLTTCLLLIFSASGQENSTSLLVEINNATTVTGAPAINTTSPLPNSTIVEENNYEYIVKLEYYFREDKIPDFITDVISKGISETPITVADVIDLTGLQRFGLDRTEEFLDSFEIPFSYVYSIDALEQMLSSLNVEFTTFYVALNRTLALSPSTISQVLKDLEIDTGKFTLAIVLGEYNVYDILRNGTYSEQAIQRVVNTTQVPKSELFAALRDVLIEYLKKMDKQQFDSLLEINNIDQRNLFLLWKILDIRTEDVYRVEAFRKFIADIVVNLNKKTSIGIVTSKNTLLLHSDDFENCQNIANYTTTKVRSFLNYNISSEIGQMIKKISRNIVEIDLKNRSNASIGVGTNFTANIFQNCTYVTFVQDNLIFQNIDNVRNYVDYLEIDKTNQTFFNPGSPLICGNRLFGMAAARRVNTIDFDSFYDYQEGRITETSMPPQKTTHAASVEVNAANSVKSKIVYSLVYSILLLFSIL